MNSTGEKTGTAMPAGVAKSGAAASKKTYQMKEGKASGSMGKASGMTNMKKGLAPSLVSCCKKKYKA